jgi:glycerol kinase
LRAPAPLRALALDLGTTRIKLAALGEDGALSIVGAADAAPIRGEGAVRESDALAACAAAERLLDAAPGGLPIGIACQRSSFVLWERANGVPVTPLISWQDRRAASWCEAHASLEPAIARRAGLPLSPHYAGPKLAWLFERDPELRARAAAGEIAFGTLETFAAWRWSGGRAHETDLSMAARTLLADVERGEWSESACAAFGVPRAMLPRIAPTGGRSIDLGSRGRLAVSLSDQASGLLAVVRREDAESALVNLGTGGFVLRSTGARFEPRDRYVAGPTWSDLRRTTFALEGTINGGGAAADRCAAGPTPWADRDPSPDAFALPEENGLGAPHWRASFAPVYSPAASALAGLDRRRVVLEGLVFRAREILDGLFSTSAPVRVVVSGGLARDPFVPPALAACLGRPVERLDEVEATLLGAARLAAGLDPCAQPRTVRVDPPRGGDWLAAKYARWREWAARELAAQ